MGDAAVAATQQSQAIQNANTIISLSQQLLGLYNAITTLNNAWNDDASLGVIQHLATAAQGLDGSLGAADASPVNANPIDTRVAANSALGRAVSANTLTSALTQLNNIVSFINGNALGATAGVRSVLNQVTGG